MKNFHKVTSFCLFFFPKVLLYSVELEKNAHKGPSQPCGFMKLSIKKKKEQEREHVRERNCLHVFFLCKVWPQETLNQSDDKAEYEKLSWFSPKFSGGLCYWDQKQTGKKKKGPRGQRWGGLFSTYSVHRLFRDSHIIHHRKTLSAVNISPSLVAALTKNKAININADKYKANNDIPNCFFVNQLSPSILPDWLRRDSENL